MGMEPTRWQVHEPSRLDLRVGDLDVSMKRIAEAEAVADGPDIEAESEVDSEERKPVRRRWWARKITNRFRSISHRDSQETKSSGYYS